MRKKFKAKNNYFNPTYLKELKISSLGLLKKIMNYIKKSYLHYNFSLKKNYFIYL